MGVLMFDSYFTASPVIAIMATTTVDLFGEQRPYRYTPVVLTGASRHSNTMRSPPHCRGSAPTRMKVCGFTAPPRSRAGVDEEVNIGRTYTA